MTFGRIAAATLLTPFAASLTAALAVTLYFAVQFGRSSHLLESLAMFSILGLFAAPFCIAFALLLQLPLSLLAVRLAPLAALPYIVASAALGALAFWGGAEWWMSINGSGALPLRSAEEHAGRLLGMIIGLAGGAATGSLWHLLVVGPAGNLKATCSIERSQHG